MAGAQDSPIVTVFRSRLRDEVPGYEATAAAMLQAARAMPGFVDFKSFSADDGERVSIITFDSLEHHNAWRDHTDHLAAQENGRRSWYASYQIQVCRLLDERRFTAAP